MLVLILLLLGKLFSPSLLIILFSLKKSADEIICRWLDQVRFFQVAQGKMVEGSLSNVTWTESFVSNVSL
jgi:hypothetical protein